MIVFQNTKDEAALAQILSLQSQNLASTLSAEEQQREGFVTVQHDLPLLREMAEAYGHAVAVDGPRVVGYALVMLPQFKDKIPVLQPMLERLECLSYREKPIATYSYFVMGQICVAYDYRGRGLFPGLYQQLKSSMSSSFEAVITEVAVRNNRSLRAHKKIGFQSLETRIDHPGDPWEIVLWDFGARGDTPSESGLPPG